MIKHIPAIRHALSVFARLAVYGGGIVFCIYAWLLVAGLLLRGCNANAGTGSTTVVPWDVETARPAGFEIDPVLRGETLILEPRFLTQSAPMDLTSVYDARMRYRHAAMPAGEYYTATGAVHSATGGLVRIFWGPANVPTGSVSAIQYNIVLQSADGINPRAYGVMRLRGIIEGEATNLVPVVATVVDWALVEEHLNPEAAPFLGPADRLALEQRLDSLDEDVLGLISLVGSGVQGVQDALDAHISAQAGVDADQDQQIQLALDSATMGKDVTGPSTNATVVALQGRPLPPVGEVPENNQAMIWDSALGRWVHRLVDLSPINVAISNLQAGAVTKSYVDTEISEVRGLVDGNDHALQLTESFASADWLEIASGVWQHSSGWMAYGANIVGGDLVLSPSGYMIMDATQCVSRIALTPSAGIWSAAYATNGTPSTWWGYDATRDNIPATNMFWVRLFNWSGSPLTVGQIQLYTWQFPERVGFTRDFAGLYLEVDTPSGSRAREAANVQYVRTLAATGDFSGTFAAGFRADKIAQGVVNNTARANGYGLIWYQSVSEHRYVDLATQFELDAAVALLATWTAHSNLVARMDAAEAGTGVALNGEVVGTAASNRVVKLLGANLPAGPAPAQHSLVMGAGGTWELKTILSSNIVYAAGTNSIESVPAQSAAFFRAQYGTNHIMVWVNDQQILGWLGTDGLTIPYGTLNILQSNLTANVRLYDGSAAQPSLATASDPDTGWYRAAEDTWRYVAAGNLVADFGIGGIVMQTGKTITLADGSRAASLADLAGGVTEVDPLSIRKSTTVVAWTNAGGTYTNAGIIATSPAISNGVASVSWLADSTNIYVEMSDLNLSTWNPFAPFATPGHVRVVIGDPAGAVVSNIAAMSWTRPDLVGQTADTAGQIIHVDPAVQSRQPVPLAQMDTAVSAVADRVTDVEAWPTGTWSTAYGWGDHASAGYIDAAAATSAAAAVIAPYTGSISTAWQNPADATNWTWTSDGNEITLTGYSTNAPLDVVIPDMLDGLPVTAFGTIFSPGFAGSPITSVTGGAHISVVADGAFFGCTDLVSLSLPSATVIGDAAIATCTTLAYASLPSAVAIGVTVFSDCPALTSLSLPSAVTIADGAITACPALTSVDLPRVASVGEQVFSLCTNLVSVSFSGDAPAEADDVFGASPQAVVYITNPAATGWGATWNGQPVVRMPIAADTATIGGAIFSASGTNILIIIGGVTNRVVLEAYSGE